MTEEDKNNEPPPDPPKHGPQPSQVKCPNCDEYTLRKIFGNMYECKECGCRVPAQ